MGQWVKGGPKHGLSRDLDGPAGRPPLSLSHPPSLPLTPPPPSHDVAPPPHHLWQRGLFKYTGQWEGDLQHGQGTCHYADGSTYEGQWHEGARWVDRRCCCCGQSGRLPESSSRVRSTPPTAALAPTPPSAGRARASLRGRGSIATRASGRPTGSTAPAPVSTRPETNMSVSGVGCVGWGGGGAVLQQNCRAVSAVHRMPIALQHSCKVLKSWRPLISSQGSLRRASGRARAAAGLQTAPNTRVRGWMGGGAAAGRRPRSCISTEARCLHPTDPLRSQPALCRRLAERRAPRRGRLPLRQRRPVQR